MIGISADITARKHAEETLRASQRFVQSSLDALTASIAILDESGFIVGLNEVWRQSAQENHLGWPDHGLGRNYLTVCDTVEGEATASAQAAAAGIRAVTARERDHFSLEYACHSPTEQRWFVMHVTAFDGDDGIRVVIAYEDITNRKEAEKQLAQSAANAERIRLARDLHDSVTQTLYGLDLFANATQQAVAANKTDIVVDHAQQIRTLSQQALADMRRLLFELRPPMLEEMGIVDALRTRLEMVEARAGIETDLQTNVTASLPADVETELYAIALEALNNSLKHGQAARISLVFDYDGFRCSLMIQDDGVGFDIEGVKHGGGHGLRNMQERADQIDGLLTILSTPGSGVTIKVEATP